MLSEYAGQYGYQLFVIEKERYQDRIISSTYIKEVLRDGDVEKAAKMLGYAYAVDGVVEHGKRLGRTLGFPTVNLHWPEDKIVPPKGVYFSRVRVDGAVYHGISNVGIKPTVSDEQRLLVESFLFGYEGDAYGNPGGVSEISQAGTEVSGCGEPESTGGPGYCSRTGIF